MDAVNFVANDLFLEAFRDAGYRGVAGALSELIDNSLEAGAGRVDITFSSTEGVVTQVSVLDDGCGIPPEDLSGALQFGGSTRFDSRSGFGRYGIGLPGSSISQARRVDVYSWTSRARPWWSYLALDDIRTGRLRLIPRPVRATPPVPIPSWASNRGTLVIWGACDRVDTLQPDGEQALRISLGRTFREAIWSGRQIRLNEVPLVPVDPLFLRPGFGPAHAKAYGPPLAFEIDLPGHGRRRRAAVIARFSELPVERWAGLSNAQKRILSISNGAGVSILRAGREIDRGWFFMGDKRRESYDDWWRCEVSFAPELDEFFGVTHTKQGIHPSPSLLSVLTPHIERTAHVLNSRVRRQFQRRRSGTRPSPAARRAEQRDDLLEPLRSTGTRQVSPALSRGLRYEIAHQALKVPLFFLQEQKRGILRLTFNSAHPFHAAVFSNGKGAISVEVVNLLLLGAARAERRLASARDRAAVARYREHWSNALAAFFA
jgi:hypothetical protein